MYNPLSLGKGLSLVKVIGGISKTLQVANQIIPLYQKAKPAISNARNVLKVLKGMMTKEQVNNKSKIVINEIKEEKKTKKEENSPTFFL